MKKRYLTILICIISFAAAICLTFLACENDNIPEYSYTKTNLQFIENGGDRLIYGNQADFYETEHAKYLFDTSVPEKDKNKCIYYTEQVLSYTSTKRITVCIFNPNTYNYTYFEENTLYTHVQNFKSVEYTANLLLAEFGSYCNYGLAYGYANYISEKLGREYSEASDTNTISAENCYDLNLLCFSSKYVSQNDVSLSKELAIRFVNDYMAQNGAQAFEEIFASSGDTMTLENFNAALSHWYEQIGVTYTPTNILYRNGGELYEFIADNHYAIFYVRKGWTEKTTERYTVIDKDFLHKNYAEVKEYFESNTASMTNLRKLFDLDNYYDPVNIYYKNTANGTWFGSSTRTITIDAICHLLHEYIHSLTEPYLKENQLWVSEGLSQYFSYYYEYPLAIEYFNYDMNNCVRQANTEILYVFKERLGRDIDLSKDVNTLNDVITYFFDYSSPNASYYAAASFLNYIVTNYGEQAAINYYLSHGGSFAELDKSFDELTSDWINYIDNTYYDYPKYAH